MIVIAVIAGVVVLGGLFLVLGKGGSGTTAGADAPAEPTQKWTVTNVVRETPSTVSFEVDAQLTFKAGQFVLIRPKPELPFRAYSFSRAPGEPLRLTVKHVPNGQVSTHVTQALKAGDVLDVKGPYGQFVLPDGAKAVLLLAGGSGVTPMLSMLRALDAKGWPAAVTLIDGNRTAAEIILKGELDQLTQKSQGKLSVQHVLDDAAAAPKGPLAADVLEGLLAGAPTPDVIAVCGPTPMMEAARAVLAKRFPGVKVLEEKFAAEATVSADAPSCTVTVVDKGKEKSFSAKQGEHVLTAARKGKVSLQAGCEMGACGTCRVKVLSGTIDTPADSCLSDDERAQGFALVCVGKAKSDVKLEPAP